MTSRSALLTNMLGGRLPRSEWYPSNEDAVTARMVALRTGERARVVCAGPSGGVPVLLVHGWGCSAYFYRKVIGPLAQLGHHVAALDLRGHGLSEKPVESGRYTAEAMADFAEAVIEALELVRPHVLAHSLGGGIMLDVAVRGVIPLASLTLLAPVGLAPVRYVAMARIVTPPAATPLVPYASPRWSIPLVLRSVYGTLGSYTARDVDEYWAPTQDPAFAQALRSLLHDYRFTPRDDAELARVLIPVRVILGGRDLLVRSRSSARRVVALPNATVQVIERAGHVLAEEVPERVLSELVAHIALARGPSVP